MSVKEFDPVDAALTVTTLMSAFIVVGVAQFDLFGVDFAATVTTIMGYDLSVAWVLAAGGVAGTLLTNDNTEFSTLREDVSQLDQYYAAAVVGTFALLLAWPVFPQVPEFFTSQDLWGVVYVFVVTTGQFVMGWIL